MNNHSPKHQYVKRLQSLKTAQVKAQKFCRLKRKTIQQGGQELLKKKQISEDDSQLQKLQQVVKKIKINTLVDQFVYKMKRNIVSKQPVEYEMIQKTLSQMKSYQSYIKTLNLNQKLVAIFMIVNILAILLIQTLAAFQGFYRNYGEEEARRPVLIALVYFCLITFFLKLVFSFLFNQRVNGAKQKYVRFVAKNYFFSMLFVFDFMNFFMTLFKVIFPTNIVFGVLCFVVTAFSLPVLSKDFEIVETVFFNNYRKRQYFSVFKIFIFNLFFAQFVSSIMMAVSYYDLQNNWIHKAMNNGVIAPDIAWWKIYFYSMYWAITTLTTIGYGDLTPANYFQVIFISFLMLIGTVVLSYNLSEIGNVISNLRKIDKRRKEQTVIFKRMAKDECISEELIQKILGYIEKSAEVRAQFQFQQRKNFLEELPEQLKQSYSVQYSNHIFSKIPFFNLLQLGTLINLSVRLKGAIYYPGQFLTKRDSTLSSIMFLKHGKVGFAYHKFDSILNGLVLQNRQINQYKDSPYLLNKYLLTSDRQINYQIIAENFCYLLILQYQDFYSVLRQSKKDIQFYFSLYSRISYIDQEWDQFQCKYCAPKRHTVFLCPKLHYMPYKSIVLQKFILSPSRPQNRILIYKRKNYQLKMKKSFQFWKQFFQFVQIEFAAGFTKKLNKKVYQRQQLKENKSSFCQKQTNPNELILSVAHQVLRIHCCQLNEKYQKKRGIQIDQMHDFVYFFPEHNPGNIKMLSLKSLQKLRYRIKLKF